MFENYYLVKQEIPYLASYTNKIYLPCNMSHLKSLISCMIGNIQVFLYNHIDNSRKDLTSSLGCSSFDFSTLIPEKVNKYTFHLKYSGLKNQRYTFFSYSEKVSTYKYSKFFTLGFPYIISSLEDEGCCHGSYFYCDLDKKTYGKEYEVFIAKKYEEIGYSVVLQGIEKGIEDGGVDLIATKGDNICFVQCKNWSLSSNYKIKQKDLRAFIGDCYLYILKNHINRGKVAMHFIVSHNNILSKSAEIFLSKNKFLKFKCIPFEK